MQKLTTNHRRSLGQIETSNEQEKQRLQNNHLTERRKAEDRLRAFETGEKLRSLHTAEMRMRGRSDAMYGSWGSYDVPEKMPSQVELCTAKVSLPTSNGTDKTVELPVWIDLFTTNIVVITPDPKAGMDQNSEEKKLIRRFLARMLKSIPPEYCSYTIFDMLHKGASLGRLIDVMNIGTTEINFELFTSTDAQSGSTSGAERRRYLCNRPADINKFIAGRSDSLFTFNRENGEFEYPFTWIVDFDFPDDPDQQLLRDMKELFVNARAAGYSFVFVTGQKGAKKIEAMAKQYANCLVTQLDMERMTCSKESILLNMGADTKPNADQIYNYITALKNFYETSGVVDNRMRSSVERNYQLKVFMSEYSDLMVDHGEEIRAFCRQNESIRLVETTAEWCAELKELESVMENKLPVGDTVCMFIGLEVAAQEFSRLPDRNGASDSFSKFSSGSFLSSLMAQQPESSAPKVEPEEFNAMPIIRKLFSSGARYSIRCVCEVSVYRQMRELVKLEDMCKHRIAYSMSADDCIYLCKPAVGISDIE